jgi:hypothetical protein
VDFTAVTRKDGVFCELSCVALVRTGISKERSPSFIMVTRISELGTTLTVTNNLLTLRRNRNSSQRASVVSYS